jgi:hypothetical protein
VLASILPGVFIWILDPVLLTLPTTPTGYDLGPHLVPLREAASRLLPEGRLHGWSHAWFAGFPLYYFYFPLPVLLTAAFDAVVSFEVAAKLVSVSGIVMLPFGALALALGMGIRGWRAGLLALAAGSMGLMQSYVYLGGNLASTLAGEFSYGLSFTFSLVYLGLILAAADPARRRATGVAAGLVLALVALSHVLTTFAVVVASLPLLALARARRAVLVSWVLGFALSAWWSVPFLLRSRYMPHYRWEFPPSLGDVLPGEILPLLPLAAAGAWVLARRRAHVLAVLAGAAVAALGFYLVPPSNAFPGRVLPYWFLTVHVLAGWAAVAGVDAWLAHRETRPRRGLGGMLGAGLAAVAFAVTFAGRDLDPLRTWARWNYSGFEAKQAPWGLVEAIRELPPGRVHWEDDAALLAFGTPHALTLLPYFAGQSTLGGLLLESSLTGPFYLRIKDETSPGRATQRPLVLPTPYPTDYARGFRHLAMFGVPWYVAISAEARAAAAAVPGVQEVLSIEAAGVFRVPHAGLVTVLEAEPVVLAEGDFGAEAVAWFDGGGTLDGPLLVRDGPAHWARVADADAALALLAGAPDAEAQSVDPGTGADATPAVARVELGPERVQFRTEAVGQPHLVKVSYFPNWRARGARGPWWVAPSLMLVVPTDEEVTLVFEPTWVERLGDAITLLGVLSLLVVGAAAARRARPAPRAREDG